MSSITEGGISAGLERIEAPMNYLVDTGEKPVNYMYAPPEGVPSTGFLLLIDPENGRSMAVEIIDANGKRSTREKQLLVKLRITSIGATQALEYTSWGEPGPATAISSCLARRRTTEGGAWATGAS